MKGGGVDLKGEVEEKQGLDAMNDGRMVGDEDESLMIPVSTIFGGVYPVGEIQNYIHKESLFRVTSEEKMGLERIFENEYNDIRQAAEVHRRVRKFACKSIKPGMKMIDIVNMVESRVLKLIEADGLKRGWGFPTGVSVNNCAAHYTPNPGDGLILEKDDVLKLDFGVHVNGRIVDSACTLTWNPRYDRLLEAVKEATNVGIRESGIDVYLGDIGAAIQEAMESYEVELNGRVYEIKSIRNLNGHSIEPYIIHAGKSVPIVAMKNTTRMVEGECYAIETFGSTGKGIVHEDGECSHYSKTQETKYVPLKSIATKQLLSHINKVFGTLPFCRRWLHDAGIERHILALKQLVNSGIIKQHPPLVDVKGSYTAQFEHTIILRPTCKEVVSRSDDY